MAFFELPPGDGTNYERLFERSPAVYAAWQQLNGAIKETVDLRLYEVATIAAAAELRSSYCSLAHGKVLFEQFGVAPGDPLDARDRAVQRVARKVVADATSVTQDDLDELRREGLSEDEVFAVILAAAARCFFSKTLDAAGLQPDASYRDALPDAVREPLVVGRPIES
jgi:alkylhydroperoxidase family enzyme